MTSLLVIVFSLLFCCCEKKKCSDQKQLGEEMVPGSLRFQVVLCGRSKQKVEAGNWNRDHGTMMLADLFSG